MTKKNQFKIQCRKCGENIILDELLTQQLREEVVKDFEKKHQHELTKIKSRLVEKEEEMGELEKSVETKIKYAITQEKKTIESEAKKKAEESLSGAFNDLKEQLKEKTDRLKETEKKELKLIREKRDLEEAKEAFELESQRKLDEERGKIYEKAADTIEKQHQLKDKEKDKVMEGLKNQVSELNQKLEQGSQKIQGEVLEEHIEEVLKGSFNSDEILAISSGVNGADILQKVCLKTGKACGTILIETKNTKNWSNSWIPKIKKDQLEEKADIAVIATVALPDEIETFDFKDGVIVVHYHQIIPVVTLLRNQLFEVTKVKNFSIGKNEKMEAVYNYLTSPEFKQRVESMVEAFAQMHNELQKEKRVMNKLWSKREKQIQQCVFGITGVHGSMQGILGSSLPEIKSLEISNLIEEDKE